MPSADCYSNSDQDCGSVVKYTLQCEYPERVDFGPDRFGAFFGDVELGRIVQEERAEPVPCTSTAPTPPPHQITQTNHVPSTGSYTGNVFPSYQVSSSSSESSQPQFDISSSYIAEHASFINEYSELNEDPDSRRTNDSRSRSGSGILHGPPPDYVRISVVLLIFSPPCACIALYWALKAKQHMKKGENKQAWQLSDKAFYCLLIGLLCFLVIIVSWSVASLVRQFRDHSGNHVPNVPRHNKNPANDAHMRQQLEEDGGEVLDRKQQASKDNPLQKILDHVSAGRVFGESPPFHNTNLQEVASPETAEPRMSRDTTTQEMPLGDHPKQRKGLAFHFPGAEAETIEDNNEDDKEQEGQGSTFDLNPDVLVRKVPRTTKLPSILLSSGSPRSRLPTRSGDQSRFKLFFNNPKQLLERTTVDPIYESGVPISSEQAASEIPRQVRRRRNVRRRPRGRRRHPGT